MKALDLAQYIVNKCIQDNHPISNLQLQKIMFFIQKEFLQNNFGIAFEDRIEAWQFGPVVPITYSKYCCFGGMPITIYEESPFIPEHKNLVDNIIIEKRKLRPWDMVEMTHKPGGAWDNVYKHGDGLYGVIYSDNIKDFG